MGTIATNCLTCDCKCGIAVHMEDGRVTAVEGRTDDPYSRGFICPKGRALPDIQNAADRLRSALQKRPGGGWRPIPLEDALDLLAARLAVAKERDGARSLAVHVGEAGIGKEFTGYAQRFCQLYGTPNFSHAGAHCHMAKEMAGVLTYGTLPVADYGRSRCLVFWGTNPTKSYPALARPIGRALRAGAASIVVDPYETQLARRADIHLRLRPGSDGALALGFIHVLIRDELFDRAFVREWCRGFEELAAVAEEYSPQKVQELTWVPARQVEEAAQVYGRSKPGCIGVGIAVELQSNGVQSLRAIACLQAISGNLDVAGGALFSRGPRLAPLRLKPAPSTDGLAVGADEFPAYHDHTHMAQANLYPRAILDGVPYPVTTLIVDAGNPLITWPGSSRVKEAFAAIDYLAVMDHFMTDTANLADLVLPAATFLERDEFWNGAYLYGSPRLGLAPRSAEPTGCLTDWQLWQGLARRLGYESEFPWQTELQALEWRLGPLGVTLPQLRHERAGVAYDVAEERKFLTQGFKTPSGKVELWSSRLEGLGYDPLPRYVEAAEAPSQGLGESASAFPFLATSGARSVGYLHSRYRNIPALRALSPEPVVQASPGVAAALGLAGGELVAVVSRSGRLEMRLELGEGLDGRVVRLPHGWSEANANLLTDCAPESLDPISGFPACRSFPVKLEPTP